MRLASAERHSRLQHHYLLVRRLLSVQHSVHLQRKSGARPSVGLGEPTVLQTVHVARVKKKKKMTKSPRARVSSVGARSTDGPRRAQKIIALDGKRARAKQIRPARKRRKRPRQRSAGHCCWPRSSFRTAGDGFAERVFFFLSHSLFIVFFSKSLITLITVARGVIALIPPPRFTMITLLSANHVTAPPSGVPVAVAPRDSCFKSNGIF